MCACTSLVITIGTNKQKSLFSLLLICTFNFLCPVMFFYMDHCACYTSTIVILKYAFCSARFISVTKTVAFSDLQGIQVAVHNGKGDKGAPRSLTVRKFHDLLEQRRVILPVLPMFTVFGCG